MASVYLRARVHPGAVDLTVIGPVTAQTTPKIRATLGQHSSAVTSMRLRACTGIDPDGLCTLLLADIEAGEAGGAIYLLDVPPLIEHYLRAHHASHLLAPPAPPIA